MMTWVQWWVELVVYEQIQCYRKCYMKVKRMGITEILRRIWLFSANKIKSSESVSEQPTQLIVELNSSLRHIIVTMVTLEFQLNSPHSTIVTIVRTFFKTNYVKMPSWSSHFSSFANSSFGFSSFLQQIWFFDGHLPSSALMKTSLNLTPEFDFPPNLSKHWPFSTHLKPSFLNSGSEQSWIILASWQQAPGSFAALGSFQGFIKGSLLVSGTPEVFKTKWGQGR